MNVRNNYAKCLKELDGSVSIDGASSSPLSSMICACADGTMLLMPLDGSQMLICLVGDDTGQTGMLRKKVIFNLSRCTELTIGNGSRRLPFRTSQTADPLLIHLYHIV